MGADKFTENTLNAPKFICPNCLPKTKSLGFWWKKASLGVHSPCLVAMDLRWYIFQCRIKSKHRSKFWNFHIFFQSIECSWAHPTNVWRQEHDGCLRPPPWPLLDCCSHFPRPYVHEGSGRTNVEHSKQKQLLLCWMDPQQCQDRCLRHPSSWPQNGLNLHWKFNCRSRNL